MQKRKQQKQIPLFDQLADTDQLRGFKTADDREFEKEQKRKVRGKRHVPLAKAPATGPACLRCGSWRAPQGDEEFGVCRHLVKTLSDAPWANAPAGTVVDRETAQKDWRVEWDLLRTGEAFSCSAYKHASEEEAA